MRMWRVQNLGYCLLLLNAACGDDMGVVDAGNAADSGTADVQIRLDSGQPDADEADANGFDAEPQTDAEPSGDAEPMMDAEPAVDAELDAMGSLDGTIEAGGDGSPMPDAVVMDAPPADAVVPGACVNDSECTDGLHCFLQLSRCMTCGFDEDCATDQRCAEGECVAVTACGNTLDCPTGQVCDSSTSTCEHCVQTADCDDGEVCQNRECATGCDSDLDCMAEGRLCNGTACVQCIADADCDADYFCLDNVCTRDVCQAGDGFCRDERTFVRCAPNGSAIDNDRICQSTQTCAEVDGTERCWTHVCEPLEQRCNSEGLLETCNATQLGFSNPTACSNGTCRVDRCVDFCEDGILSGTETDVDCGGDRCGACVGGQQCDNDSDCALATCGTDGRCESIVLPYVEPFDDGAVGWSSGGQTSSWEFGTPSGTRIDAAPTGSMVWATNLSGDYLDGEFSWVQSPMFDFTDQPVDPVIRFMLTWETESCCDEGWLEVSTDAGQTWTKLELEAGIENWYNDPTREWWDGSSDPVWVPVRAYLAGTAGESQVAVRFVFSSDGSVRREGFAFDDVEIREDHCGNGIQDFGETSVDCGGGCLCPNGGPCTIDADCRSNRCDPGNVCGSCSDGIQNGDELQVDCAGSCPLCPTGTPCSSDATCRSGVCEDMTCNPPIVHYFWDFDTDDGGWTTGANPSSWEWGQPNGTEITAATGDLAWATNLDGDYMNGEASDLTSPVLDLSTAAMDVDLRFEINFITERCCDEIFVELSTDGGSSWARVVDMGAATNWYNDLTNQWWDGSSEGWVTAQVTLPGTAGEAQVQIRFRLNTDGSVVREGLAIDDVVIGAGL